MNSTLAEKTDIYYYDANRKQDIPKFSQMLTCLIKDKLKVKKELVLLCIGSDRATGDCLGPIIGYKLSHLKHPGFFVYGTLSEPVHAKNLEETMQEIRRLHPFATVIAIDASLGSSRHIGCITLGEGSLCPGIGVDKVLPAVGDIFITGIVNISGILNNMVLQTTRLDVVMQLADFICLGIKYSIISSLIL